MNSRPKRASRRPAKLMECRHVSYCRKLTANVRFLIAIPNHLSIKHGWTAEPSCECDTQRLSRDGVKATTFEAKAKTTILMLLQLKHYGVVWPTFGLLVGPMCTLSRCIYTTCMSCSVYQQKQKDMRSEAKAKDFVSISSDVTFKVNFKCGPWRPRRRQE